MVISQIHVGHHSVAKKTSNRNNCNNVSIPTGKVRCVHSPNNGGEGIWA